jgi:hypothetical protein
MIVFKYLEHFTSAMKSPLLIISLLGTFPVSCIAQQWDLALARPSAPVSIVVPAYHLVEFGSIRSGNQIGQSVTLDFGNGAATTTTTGAFPEAESRYVGPLTITIAVNGQASAFHAVPFRITNSTAVSTTPSNAVVIPTNTAGNVQIILESSTDLVNWTAANPGSYSSSGSNRFFRVRALQP